MKAMLLAAGVGRRLQPLTDRLPKPLLEVAGKSLLEHHLVQLRRAGITEVVINVHHLGAMIEQKLGDGSSLGMNIAWSREPRLLETGGGVKQALPLLGAGEFLLLSADVYADFDLPRLRQPLIPGTLGRLLMVPNPPHHPQGDYAINANHRLTHTGHKLTWACAALLSPQLVSQQPEAVFKLRKVFDQAVTKNQLEACLHPGHWQDVGTLERYESLLAKQE